MRRILNWLPAMGMLLLMSTSCQTFFDDDDFSPGNLPDTIKEFIQSNFSGYTVQSVDLEDICDDEMVYEVELEDGPGPDVELYFTLDWEFLFKATDISKDDLPAEVLTAIETGFAGYHIDEDDLQQWEFADGSLQFEIDLDIEQGDNVEVVFAADGNIVCQKNNDDDDDDDKDDNSGDDDGNDDGDDNVVNLPDDVKDFIQTNYPGYDIEEVEEEDICDDQKVIEVELEDGPGPDIELYFSLDWEFLFKVEEISEDDLPQEVLAAIASEFPGYEIEDDDIRRFELADGSFQYEVELEKDDEDDDDVEVVFAADGSIVCQKK